MKDTFCSAFYILWWETVDESSVWEDKWCGAEPLTTKFPDIYSIIIKKDVSIVDCWVNDQQTWDLGIRRPLFDRELQSGDCLFPKCLGCGNGKQ